MTVVYLICHVMLKPIISKVIPFRWVEQDPLEILSTVRECMENVIVKLKNLNIDPKNVKGEYSKYLINC